MFSKYTTRILAAAVLLALAMPIIASAADEDALIAALTSEDASLKDKFDACRELATFGTAKAVPYLVALLDDPKMTHMACYGLETIPDASVDAALRKALGTLKGRQLACVVGTIGVRGDREAAEAMVQLLSSDDPMVVQVTARALGNIRSRTAARGLLSALPNTSGRTRAAICEGLFRTAEALHQDGMDRPALMIYGRLAEIEDAPHFIQTGALRGRILAGQDMPLLMSSLNAPEYLVFQAAARTSMEMPAEEVTDTLISALKSETNEDRQVMLITTLAMRKAKSAQPLLAELAKKAPRAVRVAAIEAFAQIGDATTAVPLLQSLREDKDPAVGRAVAASLSTFETKAE